MIQLHRGLAALCALLCLSGPALATNAPTYTNEAGQARGAQGVVVLDASGNIVNPAAPTIPTGASTSAKQDTANTTLTAIDGHVDGLEAVIGTVAAGTAATNSAAIGGLYNSTQPTLTTGQQAAVQLDSRGNQKVIFVVPDGQTTIGTVNGAVGDANSNTVTAYKQISHGLVFDPTSGAWMKARGDTGGAVTQPFAVTGSRWQYAGVTGGITDTSDAAVAAAAGASIRNYLVGLQFFNSAATASEIVVKDGSTVIWRGYVPASMTAPVAITFSIPLKGTANTALNVAMLTTATATRVSAQGFTGS